jgi:N-acetylglucosamine kinase-like BadF-type ATPase
MDAVLGVEGGGSHSHAVVADVAGRILGVGKNDDAANWEDVGIAAASAAIRSCVKEAFGAAGLEASAVTASIFGLAGVDFPVDEQLLSGIPLALGLGGHTSLVNDAFVGLRAGTDQAFGLVVVAGTGAVVAGRNRGGEVFRTLGLGPIYGDAGSGTEISQAGVGAVADEFTGRGPATLLTKLLCEQTNSPSVAEFIEATARGRNDDSLFAPLVIEAANHGDEAACRIISTEGGKLGANAVHVLRTLGMEGEAFDVVLAGGMFRYAGELFVKAVERAVQPVAPRANFVLLEAPPVVGAVLLALEAAGATPAPGLRAELATATTAAFGL